MAYESSWGAEDAARRLLDTGAVLMEAWHELAWEDRQRLVVDLTVLAGALRTSLDIEDGDGPTDEDVREELRTGAGTVHLQPIVRLPEREIVGFEALSRFPTWSPDRWFRQAWASGAGLDFEIVAVRRALAGMVTLPEEFYLGVNVSPMALVSDSLLDVLDGLEPCQAQRLVLELTEHEAIGDYTAYRDQIAKLRSRGVRLAIDDVGAGHSSLLHIVQLRPDVIKVDRALIAGCDRDPVREVLMQCFATLARHTRAHLIAEGVETSEEADALVRSGVALGQGYLFGRPRPQPIVEFARAVSSPNPSPIGAPWPPPFAK